MDNEVINQVKVGISLKCSSGETPFLGLVVRLAKCISQEKSTVPSGGLLQTGPGGRRKQQRIKSSRGLR